MSSTPRLEELLAHAAWARTLARSLVADPNVADDLVQEAYAAAASGSGPSHGEARGWLAEVLRNFARRRHRAESARSHREGLVSRPEATSSAAELVERAQLEHALAAAVIALDEPLRETVLLRYFEGVTSAEIARRQGLPESTVRNRLARALERLRARLDRERGGREAWMGAFAGAFGWPAASPTSLTSTGPGTALSLSAALVLALSLGVGAFALLRTSSTDSPSALASTNPIEPQGASSMTAAAPANSMELRTNAGSTVLAIQSGAPPPTTHVRGRVVRASGEPESGVALAVQARTESALGVLSTRREGAQSDTSGSFDIPIEIERPCTLDFTVRAPSFARVRARWNEIEPGTLVDVGDVELTPATRIEVALIEPAGRVLTTGWSVGAAVPLDVARGSTSTWRQASPRPDRVEFVSGGASVPVGGRFVIEDLAAGRWEISAHHATGFETRRSTVDAVAGVTAHVELVHDGLDPERCITVRAWGGRTHASDIEIAAITLRDAIGGLHSAVSGPKFSALFADLDPGQYVAEVHDPRFAAWQSESIAPGTGLIADLRGLAELELHVRLRPGADEFDEYELAVDPDERAQSVKKRGDPVPEGRVYDLAPGSYTVFVGDERGRTARLAVNDLLVGEHRVLDVAFERATRLTGRVVEADGTTPVGGARVVLQRPWSASNPRPGSRYVSVLENEDDGPIVTSTRTDEAGAFDFSGTEPGARIVRVEAGPRRIVRDTNVLVLEDDEPHDLLLTMPAGGAIRGRVVVPANVITSKHRIELAVAGAYEPDASERDPVLEATATASLEADGRFAFTRVPPGRYELHLTMPQASARPSSSHSAPSLSLGSLEIAGTETLEPVFDVSTTLPGEIAVQVFAHGEPLRDASVGVIGGELTRTNSPCWAKTDADGRATITGIAPGIRSIVVQDVRRRWVLASSETRTLEPGGTATLTIDVPLSIGTIECVGASTNARFANVQVWWIVGEPGDALYGNGVLLDDLGRARIEAPPGRYALAPIDANIGDPARRSELTWPPPEGTVLTVPLH